MVTAKDFDVLNESLSLWQCYDPAVKADLYSTAIATAAGLFLVDPILLEPDALSWLIGQNTIGGVVVTSANHCRAANQVAEELGATIFSHPIACSDCQFPKARALENGESLADDLRAIEIDGAAPGEIALYHDRDGGTMIVGDALINFEPYGFTFLPAKYCSEAKEMRRSLRRLLDYEFERMLFAHGPPLTGGAKKRLEQLLNTGD